MDVLHAVEETEMELLSIGQVSKETLEAYRMALTVVKVLFPGARQEILDDVFMRMKGCTA